MGKYKVFSRIVDDETKRLECIVCGDVPPDGFSECEIEQGFDGNWYLKGYAPEEPIEEKQNQIRFVRNQYLSDTDKFMIADFPISKEEKANYKSYRQYLRDYTEQESWWESSPKTFEEWENN